MFITQVLHLVHSRGVSLSPADNLRELTMYLNVYSYTGGLRLRAHQTKINLASGVFFNQDSDCVLKTSDKVSDGNAK